MAKTTTGSFMTLLAESGPGQIANNYLGAKRTTTGHEAPIHASTSPTIPRSVGQNPKRWLLATLMVAQAGVRVYGRLIWRRALLYRGRDAALDGELAMPCTHSPL